MSLYLSKSDKIKIIKMFKTSGFKIKFVGDDLIINRNSSKLSYNFKDWKQEFLKHTEQIKKEGRRLYITPAQYLNNRFIQNIDFLMCYESNSEDYDSDNYEYDIYDWCDNEGFTILKTFKLNNLNN